MSARLHDDWHRPSGRGGRARRRVVLGVVVLVAVVAAGGAGVRGGLTGVGRPPGSGALRVETAADDGAAPAARQPRRLEDARSGAGGARSGAADADAGLSPAGGVWRDLPPAPVRTPLRHAAAWTGESLVVVGADRAAAYAPEGQRWQRLPASPFVPPAPLVVAWTGREVLVWGDARPETGAPARGARYDPATRTWRRTAWLDLSLGAWPVVVWAGDRLLVWGAEAGAAYDPRADSWQPVSPPPVVGWGPADAVWTGTEVVVWGDAPSAEDGRARAGFTAAYQPVTDEWRLLAPSPLAGGSGTAVWTGEEVIVLGGQRLRDRNLFPGTADLVAGAALDVAAGTWRVVSAPPGFDTPARMEALSGLAAAWTGEAVVAVGGYPEGAALRYDPAAERWSALPSGPVGVVWGAGVWTGDRFLVWGGYGPEGPGVGLSMWTPG